MNRFIKLYRGNCLDVLKTMPSESVHCVVTSPPYWGLRDYGTAQWVGGVESCDHDAARLLTPLQWGKPGDKQLSNKGSGGSHGPLFTNTCPACGATKQDAQIGRELTPEEYTDNLLAVFREVKRVLRMDGTLWLNIGDSYVTAKGRYSTCEQSLAGGGLNDEKWGDLQYGGRADLRGHPVLKDKDLAGIPWRVAFALQADGWWIRNDIIWAKPNVIPESMDDRCTKSHEHVFLMTKNMRYFYDAEAIKEPSVYPDDDRKARASEDHKRMPTDMVAGIRPGSQFYPKRNKRDVWVITTQPFKGDHYASYPPALVEPCAMAGTSEKGCCAKCGAPWVRQVETETRHEGGSGKAGRTAEEVNAAGKWAGMQYGVGIKLGPVIASRTVGWLPGCKCKAGDPVPCVVLDPFSGAGTTLLVAARLGRSGIGIELNPKYCDSARQRIEQDAPLFNRVEMQSIAPDVEEGDKNASR